MPASDHRAPHLFPAIIRYGNDRVLTVVVRGRLISWDPATGLPVPSSRPVLSAPQIEALAATALSLPYDPEKPAKSDFTSEDGYKAALDKWQAEVDKYAGMTCGEVMMVKLAQHAAEGNHAATEELLDRVLGRPKQSSEVKSVSMRYEDYMQKIADDEAKAQARATAIDVAVFPPPSSAGDPDELKDLM